MKSADGSSLRQLVSTSNSSLHISKSSTIPRAEKIELKSTTMAKDSFFAEMAFQKKLLRRQKNKSRFIFRPTSSSTSLASQRFIQSSEINRILAILRRPSSEQIMELQFPKQMESMESAEDHLFSRIEWSECLVVNRSNRLNGPGSECCLKRV